MKWLNSVLTQLEGIKRADIIEPKDEIGAGEVVVATLEDESLRKLFTLIEGKNTEIVQMIQKVMHMVIDHVMDSVGHDEKTCPGCKLVHEIEDAKCKHEFLGDLYWIEIESLLSPAQLAKYKDSNYSGIGVRKGWKIVAMPPKQRRSTLQAVSLLDLLELTRR